MKTPTSILCSVLLPTRLRTDQLINCIQSIVNSSSGKHEFEIVVRIHRDDASTMARIPKLLQMANVKIVIGYPHTGYSDLSKFYDDAASVANGRFIWVMNDDVIVSGQPWDEALNAAPKNHLIMPETHRLGLSTYQKDHHTPFMLMPNKCWQRYGIEKFDTPFDFSLWTMLRKNGWPTYYLPGVIVHHDREDDVTLIPKRKLDEEHMENL